MILSTGQGRVSASVHAWDTPPRSRPPRSRTPGSRHPPWEQTPPGSSHPPGADPSGSSHPPGSRHHPEQTPPWLLDPPVEQTPPGSRHVWDQTPPSPLEQTPPPPGKQTPACGQWAAGTHPTGMHSCLNYEATYSPSAETLSLIIHQTLESLHQFKKVLLYYTSLQYKLKLKIHVGVCSVKQSIWNRLTKIKSLITTKDPFTLNESESKSFLWCPSLLLQSFFFLAGSFIYFAFPPTSVWCE